MGIDTAGLWVWRADDTIDMREHLQRRTLPAGADREVLWELIGELHSEPLDRSRPMWMAYVIDGLQAGRFAFYIKVHHTVVDGVAGLKVIADGLTTDPERRSMRPIYAGAPKQPAEQRATSRTYPQPVVTRTLGAERRHLGALGIVREIALGEISTVVASLGATGLPFYRSTPLTPGSTAGSAVSAPSRGGVSWSKSQISAPSRRRPG